MRGFPDISLEKQWNNCDWAVNVIKILLTWYCWWLNGHMCLTCLTYGEKVGNNKQLLIYIAMEWLPRIDSLMTINGYQWPEKRESIACLLCLRSHTLSYYVISIWMRWQRVLALLFARFRNDSQQTPDKSLFMFFEY